MTEPANQLVLVLAVCEFGFFLQSAVQVLSVAATS